MREDDRQHNHEHKIVPKEIVLDPYVSLEIDPSLPIRQEDDYSVVAEISTSRISMHEREADTFKIIDLASAPGDEDGNKWFQGQLIHSSIRFLLTDSDLTKVDTQQNKGIVAIHEDEVVDIGRADEMAASRFDLSEFVSREHFVIRLLGDSRLFMVDLGSSNGTRVMVGAELDEALPWFGGDNPDVVESAQGGPVASAEKQHQDVEVGEVIVGDKNPCEDTILNDQENNIYGVFDGAGGHANGDKASQAASRAAHEHMIHTAEGIKPKEIVLDVIESLEVANAAVIKEAGGGVNNGGGVTTGTIVKMGTHKGQRFAVWASVGDSPIMVFNRESGTLTRISEDEVLSPERPNVITNALGDERMSVRQSGRIKLQAGDEIIICSDGITGDFPQDVLDDNEIIRAMQSSTDPQETARALVRLSRKKDDKAVLVLK